MAEKTNNSKSWKETYRTGMAQLQNWMSKRREFCVRLLPCVVLLCAAIIGASWWYDSLVYPWKCQWFDLWLKDWLEGCVWLNIMAFIVALLTVVLLIIHVTISRPKWCHLPLYVIGAACIYYIPQWKPIETCIPHLSYTTFFSISLIVAGVLELLVLILNIISRKLTNPQAVGTNGFVVKTIKEDEMVDTGWDKYIETMFDLVGAKQLAEESFSIGIAGSWGSGKSTFYDAVKRKIETDGTFVLCEFKPWQILDSSKLASEFFLEFTKVLTIDGEKQIQKDIAKYAQLLTIVPHVSTYAKMFTSILDTKDDLSILALRNKIDERLGNSNTYVAVMIDDLDRLNKDELLGVMRIVRASANFKHVLFILTYDKSYFDKILKNEQGKEYLKKIVNVEISLPPVEQYKYGILLQKSISNIYTEAITSSKMKRSLIAKHLVALDVLISEENRKAELSVLYKYLNNFRDIKRFSNHFGLVLRHVVNSKLKDQLNFQDLFWLELLHYVDEDKYHQLKNNYTLLLRFNTSIPSEQQVLTLSSDLSKKDEYYPLLYHLFERNKGSHIPLDSIKWVNNYYNYFTYRQVDNYVSAVEFTILMNTRKPNVVFNKIYNWLQKSYNIRSVEQIINDYPQNNLFDSKLAADNYAHVLLELLKMQKPYMKSEFISEQINRKYRHKYFSKIPNYDITGILKEHIKRTPHQRWNSVLTAMCIPAKYISAEYEGQKNDDDFILDLSQLKDLALLNYSMCFQQKILRIDDLFNPNSAQMNFIMSLHYKEIDSDPVNNFQNTYNNLLGDIALKQVIKGVRRKKFLHNNFIGIYNNLLTTSGVSRTSEDEKVSRLVCSTLEKTVGSVKAFETFIEQNFEINESMIKMCNRIGLEIEKKY